MLVLKRDWQERYGHLPWYRRYEFLFPCIILIIWIGFLFIPKPGKPENFFAWMRIILFYSIFFSWALIIISDREKPVWLKRLSSLSTVFLFFLFFYYYSGADWGRMAEKFFNFEKLEGVWPMYFEGVVISMRLTLLSAVFSVAIGTFLGVLRTFKNPVLSLFTVVYVDLFRSFPLIALMMVVFYALPFAGLKLSPFLAASVSIILMYSAYISEMVRSGVESVHRSQIDAARSLGLNEIQTLAHVVIPQAIRIIIPPLTSSVVGILKDTVVAYAVTLPELLTQAKQAASWKNNPTPIIVVSLVYLIILFPLTRFSSWLERRSKRWIKDK